MDGCNTQIKRLCQIKPRRLVSMMGVMVSIFLVFNSFTLLSRLPLWPLSPTFQIPEPEDEYYARKVTFSQSTKIGKFTLPNNSVNIVNSSFNLEEVETAKILNVGTESDVDFRPQKLYGNSKKDGFLDDDIDLSENEYPDSTITLGVGETNVLQNANHQHNWSNTQDKAVGVKHISMSEKTMLPISKSDNLMTDDASTRDRTLLLEQIITVKDKSVSHQPALLSEVLVANSSDPVLVNTPSIVSTSGGIMTDIGSSSGTLLRNGISVSSRINFTVSNLPLVKGKKRMFPVSMTEMNQMLIRNHVSYRTMRLRKHSSSDKKLLAVMAQIENSPPVKNDDELYAPIFRNISMFKRRQVPKSPNLVRQGHLGQSAINVYNPQPEFVKRRKPRRATIGQFHRTASKCDPPSHLQQGGWSQVAGKREIVKRTLFIHCSKS